MNTAVFITGTDTDVGKTVISLGLIRVLKSLNHTVIGMKPIACGAEQGRGAMRNADAVCLLKDSVPQLEYATINPYLFSQATSPNIAAANSGREIMLEPIAKAYQRCRQSAEFVIVEGIGGWKVPLSATLQTADLVNTLKLPVILVCGLRLGCINHALLSVTAILDDGIELLGWVANSVEPSYAFHDETIDTLTERIEAPLMGVIPWYDPLDFDMIASTLTIGTRHLWDW